MIFMEILKTDFVQFSSAIAKFLFLEVILKFFLELHILKS